MGMLCPNQVIMSHLIKGQHYTLFSAKYNSSKGEILKKETAE